MATRQGRGRDAPLSVEDVEARALRLGITPDRVLREYARIAFSKITDIVEWDDKGVMKAKIGLDDDVLAAIAEIVASASSQKIYRIKMHDKKPVLDAIARHLGMLPSVKTTSDDDEPIGDDEAREFLIRELDRAAAERIEGSARPEPGHSDPEGRGTPEP